MVKQSLSQRVVEEAAAAGLLLEDIDTSFASDDFANGHITGRIGPLAVRFVRERGQDWLEVGPVAQVPRSYYSFQDVQIALGWKGVSDVLDMRDVEPLGHVLKLIACHWTEIVTFLSNDPSSSGWRRVAEAFNERAEAFVARLR